MGHEVKYKGYLARVLPVTLSENHMGGPQIPPLTTTKKIPLPVGPLGLVAAEKN